MVASQWPKFEASQWGEAATRSPPNQNANQATAADHPSATNKRTELDLRGPAAFAQLRQMSLVWPGLSDTERQTWLNSLEITLPPRAIAKAEAVLLPGGAVALRSSTSMLVCDPIETVTFSQAEVKHLRRVLRVRPDVSTLLHTSGGVVPRQRVPKYLSAQAATIVQNASRLPIRVSFNGAAVIQWGLHGAVARPLVPAPALLALAVSIVPSPRVNRGAGFTHRGVAIEPETWQATHAVERWSLIAAALMEHVSDLVADSACDELRLALMDACVNGQESIATRIAKALAVVPACFVADPAALAGTPPPIWRHAMAYIREQAYPRALLALDELADPVRAIRALRDTVEHGEVIAFGENNEILPGGPAALSGDTALFLARQAGPRGRLGVIVPTPISPPDLYMLADEVASAAGGRVIAVAPCWGFCHRIGPDGSEAGNAGWFGMGAGLDEADLVIGDLEFDW
jgi:hypothetical protein